MLALAPFAFVFPLGTLGLALLAFDVRKNPVQAALLVGLCFAVSFYGLRLDSSNDIARHMSLLSSYASVDFFHCFNAGHYNFLFVWDVWCWVIAKLGNPYLLQSSAAFLGYTILAFIPFDYTRRIGASRGIAATTFVLVVCAFSFLGVVSGIRSTNALLISALAAYRLYICRKGMAQFVLLSLCAIMIHPVAIMAIAITLAAKPVSKSPKIGLAVVFAISFASAALGSFLLPSLQGSTNAVAGYLAAALEAFLGYSEGNSWTAERLSSLNTRINSLFTFGWLVVIAVNVLIVKSLHKDGNVRKASGRLLTSIQAIILIGVVAIAALSIVLEANEARLAAFVFCLATIPQADRMQRLPASASKSMFVLECVGVLTAISLFMLHAYSIYYGIIRPSSFFLSLAFGVLGIIGGGA